MRLKIRGASYLDLHPVFNKPCLLFASLFLFMLLAYIIDLIISDYFEALRKALQTDVAIVNGGCLRGNTVYTPKWRDSGNETSSVVLSSSMKDWYFFTFADLIRELPYDTEICVVSMKGRILEEAISHSRTRLVEEADGGYLQTCNGVVLTQQPIPSPATSCSIVADPSKNGNIWKICTINDVPFDPDQTYRVACVYHLLQGMDDIKPLIDWASSKAPHELPPWDATQPAKDLVLKVYHREIWRSLGSFDEIDADNSDYITYEELRVALASTFGIDPSDELVQDALSAFDVNKDGIVRREEYNACMTAIEKDRFDLPAADAMALDSVHEAKSNVAGVPQLPSELDPPK